MRDKSFGSAWDRTVKASHTLILYSRLRPYCSSQGRPTSPLERSSTIKIPAFELTGRDALSSHLLLPRRMRLLQRRSLPGLRLGSSSSSAAGHPSTSASRPAHVLKSRAGTHTSCHQNMNAMQRVRSAHLVNGGGASSSESRGRCWLEVANIDLGATC